MKTKLLVSAILVSLTTSAFAIEITNGKLISHKEWTTDNSIKLAVKPSDKNLNLAILKKSGSYLPEYIFIRDDLDKTMKVVVGSEIKLSGTTMTFISNSHTTPHKYKIVTEICGALPSDICGHTEDVVTLNPYGTIQLNSAPTLSINYDTAGSRYILLSTQVIRDNEELKFSSSDWYEIQITV